MRRCAWLIVLSLSGTACRGEVAGKPCDEDDDCGPGFDCFPDVCVRVCTKDDECPTGETCFRYHCVVPGQEHARRGAPAAPSVPAPALLRPPPPPDVTAAELRAIRRELELLRQEQARLTELVQGLAGAKPGTARPDPKKPGAVSPPPPVTLP
jgi:hypothetical protein